MRSLPSYFEDWFLNRLKACFKEVESAQALEKLEPHIQVLSNLFTSHRPEAFKDYQQDLFSSLAYGVFFFPQSFIKAQFPIAEAIQYRQWPLNNNTLDILDIGSSLGPASLGIADFLSKNSLASLHIDAVDHSATSLNLLEELYSEIKHFYPKLSQKTHLKGIKSGKKLEMYDKQKQYDCIVLSFSLNEIQGSNQDIKFFKDLKSLLKPHGLLLIIEPALKETSLHLHALCNQLVAQEGYFYVGPTLGSSQPIPSLEGGKYWHHEVRCWAPPQSLIWANRKLFRDIYNLKFSYCLLACTPPKTIAESSHTFRLCSPLALLKSGFVCKGLASDGQIYTYEIPTRGLSKCQIKEKERIERGDILTVSSLTPLTNKNHFRIPGIDSILSHYSPSF